MAHTQWYAFRAYNSQALYGYGTEIEAKNFTDILNANRTVNVYGPVALTETQAAELRLEDNTEAVNLNDELAAQVGLR